MFPGTHLIVLKPDGSQPWTKLAITFDVPDAEQMVELLCELSADQGEASFRGDSLVLERIPWSFCNLQPLQFDK